MKNKTYTESSAYLVTYADSAKILSVRPKYGRTPDGYESVPGMGRVGYYADSLATLRVESPDSYDSVISALELDSRYGSLAAYLTAAAGRPVADSEYPLN